jgi:hypothetical protein
MSRKPTNNRITAVIIQSILMVGFIFAFSIVLASPPNSPYMPGEISDPDCFPGEDNCTVVSPASSGINTNILGLTGLNTQEAIKLSPFSTGQGNTSELRFLELTANGSNYVGLKAPDSVSSNIIWVLPNEDGTPNQALVTDGSGNLSWVDLNPFNGNDYVPYTGSTSNVDLGTHNFATTGTGTFGGATDTTQLVVKTSGTQTEGMFVVGSVGTDDWPRSVAVSGNYAYVANYNSNTLQTINISDPENPSVVGSVGTDNNPDSVAVSGNYAYVANFGSHTLQAIDISDPENPSVVGSVGINNYPYSVAISGNYAYVVTFSGTLQAIDISDPENPSVAGSVGTDSGTYSVAISGNYAYVVNAESDTLQVIDISDPENPSVVGSVGTDDGPETVVVSGNYAYVANIFSDTLQAIDISDPENPSVVGSAGTNSHPYSVAVPGNYAYVVNGGSNTLQAIDITDPEHPNVVGSVRTRDYPIFVTVSGNYAYVVNAYSDTLRAIDISDPIGFPYSQVSNLQEWQDNSSNALASIGPDGSATFPQLNLIDQNTTLTKDQSNNLVFTDSITGSITLAEISSGAGQTPWNQNIDADGYYLYNTAGIYDDSENPSINPNNRQLTASDGSSTMMDWSASGSIDFQTNNLLTTGSATIGGATDTAQLVVKASAEPTEMSVVGSVGTDISPYSVAISGNYAYVVNNDVGSHTLQSIDISGPAHPTVVGSVGISGLSSSVAVSGNYAYMVNWTSDNLQVIDISDPENLSVVGSVGTGSSPQSVAVSGNYAYVVNQGSDTLKAIDISDPAHPTVVGSVGTEDGPWFVAVSGNYAYVANQNSNTLQTIDISDPESPSVAGSVGTDGWPLSIAVSGNYAYVVNESSDTLQSIDISDPENPSIVGSVETDGCPDFVAISGNYAYVTNLCSATLQAIDISDPENPSIVVSMGTDYGPRSVAISGNYAYVVNNSSNTFQVIHISNNLQEWQDSSSNVLASIGPDGSATFPRLNLIDQNTNLTKDQSNNLVFTDSVTGSKTLAELAAVASQTPWTQNIDANGYYLYNTAGIYDLSELPSIDPNLRQFTASDGSSTMMDWSTSGSIDFQTNNLSTTGSATVGGAADATQLIIKASLGPLEMFVVGSVGTGSGPYSIAVSGNYAYVANYSSNTLQAIDISDPENPSVVGSVGTGNQPRSVAVLGIYAYVVNYSSKTLQVINISDPAHPSVVGSVGTGNQPRSVAVLGIYAYVVNSNSRTLQVINISDPAHPSVVGSVGTYDNPYFVAVSGNYAYVVNNGSNRLQAINISDPAHPSVVGSVGTHDNPTSVAVSGNYAYVVNVESSTLQTIDISNPAHPTVVGSVGTDSRPFFVAVSGNYAYVVNYGSRTLQAIDISDPENPSVAGSVGTGIWPYSVAVSGNYAYVVNYSSRTLQIIDIIFSLQSSHLQEWQDSSSNVLASIGPDGSATFSQLNLVDQNTNLTKDQSNNLVFTDSVAGSITLAELASLGQTPWKQNIDADEYYLYNTAGIYDDSELPSVDPNNRQLIAFDGSSTMMDWSTSDSIDFQTNNLLTTGSATIGGATDTTQLIVKSSFSPTLNLQEWQDSSSNVLASIGPDGSATFSQLNLIDQSTTLAKDQSDNLVFTDSVTGSITLSELASLGQTPWTQNIDAAGYALTAVSQLDIEGTIDEVQLIVKASSSQSSNLQEWQASSSDVLASISSNGDLEVAGKITATGGIDPAYMLFDPQTREQIISRVGRDVKEEKKSGLTVFFNAETKRLEAYIGSEGNFYDLNANLLTETGAASAGALNISQQASLTQTIKDNLILLGVNFKEGLNEIKEIIADMVFADTFKLDNLEIVDKTTNDIYCTWVENGEWQKEKGDCATIAISNEVTTPTPEAQPTPEIQPTPEVQPEVPSASSGQAQPTPDVVQLKEDVKAELKGELKEELKNELKTEINGAVEGEANDLKEQVQDVQGQVDQMQQEQQLQQEQQGIEESAPAGLLWKVIEIIKKLF